MLWKNLETQYESETRAVAETYLEPIDETLENVEDVLTRRTVIFAMGYLTNDAGRLHKLEKVLSAIFEHEIAGQVENGQRRSYISQAAASGHGTNLAYVLPNHPMLWSTTTDQCSQCVPSTYPSCLQALISSQEGATVDRLFEEPRVHDGRMTVFLFFHRICFATHLSGT